MNKVLIVDATHSDFRIMSSLLTKAGYEPIGAEYMEKAKEELAKMPPGAVVVAAMKFTDGTVQELINWQKQEGLNFPTIAVVDNINTIDIIDIMRGDGAIDVIQRPAIDRQLVETVGKYAKPENIVLQLDNTLIPRQSKTFKKIEQSITEIASTNVNCIIFGECGTGKEQVARQIYLQSSRTQKPLVVIEAGGAALVGKHEPDSDRSETYDRIEGYFRDAKGGTIIVKNIQLLTFERQSVLLHIFEQEHPEARIICTANASLLKMVAEEKFRDNLFFTLRQTSINVPPLRETTDDISDIADYLLSKYARKTQQPKKRLDASAIKALKLHPWPGNIRELKDVVLFAAFHVKGEVITVSDLRFDEARLDNAEDLTHRNSKAEKERILKAFKRARTWRGAAKLLGISEMALFELRKKHGINTDGEMEY